MMIRAPTALYSDLDGKTVFVSGGASGIGADIVAAFAAQKAATWFVDLDAAAGEALAARLSAQTGTACVFERVDVTDTEALVAVIDRAAQETGRLDAVINNAANDKRQDVATIGPADWRTAMAVNLDHQFFAAQAAFRHMAPRRSGSIVNVGSTSYMLGVPDLTAYATAKSAVRGLTRQLAREYGRDLVRVNAIVPGAILTQKQLDLWISPEREAEILALQCLPRRLVGHDVAELALFLASDVSSACTAQDFRVDGGIVF